MVYNKKTAKESGEKSSRKNIPNKDTVKKRSILDAFEKLMSDEKFVIKFTKQIQGMTGTELMKTISTFLEYISPKLARTENVNLNLNQDVEVKLPKELLDRLIKK